MSDSGSAPLAVVLVEDSPLLRQRLYDMLSAIDGVEVVAQAADEASALAQLQQHRADLAIVDLQLAAGSGLGVLRALSLEPERYGRPRAVVFTNYGHRQLRERCHALGVERFFDKSLQMDELLDYIEQARRDLAGAQGPAPSPGGA